MKVFLIYFTFIFLCYTRSIAAKIELQNKNDTIDAKQPEKAIINKLKYKKFKYGLEVPLLPPALTLIGAYRINPVLGIKIGSGLNIIPLFTNLAVAPIFHLKTEILIFPYKLSENINFGIGININSWIVSKASPGDWWIYTNLTYNYERYNIAAGCAYGCIGRQVQVGNLNGKQVGYEKKHFGLIPFLFMGYSF